MRRHGRIGGLVAGLMRWLVRAIRRAVLRPIREWLILERHRRRWERMRGRYD